MLNLPFLRRRRETFGLDIGSSAGKGVQLREGGGGHRLGALGIAPLPPHVISEGTIKEPAVVSDAINEAVSKAGVKSKDAAIAVSGRELIIKKVQIPEVPPKELHDAVQLEAEHHIPFAIDEVFLDYHVVGKHDGAIDRKSTRLNSSHVRISYAVFCLKKKTIKPRTSEPRLIVSEASTSQQSPQITRSRVLVFRRDF